jgi:lysyl-tRNA synthetase class 2
VDLYLRIAPELYLKRLVTGGFPKVYEINRNFRNEGISTQHNPEFTMLEFYTAYADARDQMALTEELFSGAAKEILGTTELAWGDERISLDAPFRRISMKGAVVEYGRDVPGGPILPEELETLEGLKAAATRAGVEALDRFGDVPGKILAELFETLAEPHLLQPTFVVDYPAEISPLSKTRPDDPSTADRFELFIGRMELANGFSELNDPDEQADKFRAQVAQRAKGDDEAMLYDEDYVEALSYGMPPTAGEGVGIDRLAMLFTNSRSIRDVILFPLMRPKGTGR